MIKRILFCLFIIGCNSDETGKVESKNETMMLYLNGKGSIPVKNSDSIRKEIDKQETRSEDTTILIDSTKRKLLDSLFKHIKLDTLPEISYIDNDLSIAYAHINWAWNDHGPCSKLVLCATYIGDIEIRFNEALQLKFPGVVQRLTTSAHDCIQNAKNALLGPNGDGKNPNHGLAVTWVIASQIHNKPVYEWLKNHGDAVIKALKMIR